MKLKKALCFGALFAIAGLTLILVGLSALGWDIYALDPEQYTARTVTADDGLFGGAAVTAIDADISDFNVSVTGGEQFRLDLYEPENTTAEISFADGVLTVRAKRGYRELFNADAFKGLKRNLYSYKFVVPEGVDLSLNADNSTVSISSARLGGISLSGNNGLRFLSDVSASGLTADFKNGVVRIDGCAIDAAGVKLINGLLDVKNSTFGAFGANLSNTSLKAGACAFGDIAGAVANGLVRLDGCSADSVVFDGFSNSSFDTDGALGLAADFRITGVNARIDARLSGTSADFAAVKMSGANSSFRLDGKKFDGGFTGGGTKIFDVNATNSSVKLSFAG
jgi:hypothetical protein